MHAFRGINIDAILLLAVASSVPVLLSMALGAWWAAPIDGGRRPRDARPIFGSHKTWCGLLCGTAATGAMGALLAVGFRTGAAFGFLALLGDLLSSFIKRRTGFSARREALLLDQRPEALLPLLLLHEQLHLNCVSLLFRLGAFVLLGSGAAKLFTYRRTPDSPSGS